MGFGVPLAWATVRARWVGFVGSFVALTLGVGVLTATLVVFVSAQPALPPRLAGASVIVHGPVAGTDYDMWDEHVPWTADRADEIAGSLREIPGVAAAVPDRSFYAQLMRDGVPVGDPDVGDPQGHAFSTTALAPYELVAGEAPRAQGEVAISRKYGFAPGSEATVLTAAGPNRWRVTGVVDGPGFYVADSVAAKLAGGPRAIGVVTGPGADVSSVAAAARTVVASAGVVVTGDARVALEPESHASTRWLGTQLLTVMATLASFATIFVMASTAALNAWQRRRELALLRAVGATPRQIRRLLLGEALVVGAVSALVGALLGSVAAPIFGDLLVGAHLEPEGFEARATPLPLAVAIGVGLVVALVGTWAASRRAARVRPMEALRESDVERRPMTLSRWILGGFLGVVGIGLAVLVPVASDDAAATTAMASALTLIVALTLLAPVVIPPLVRLLTLPFGRLRGATGMLVRQSAVTAVRRTAATVGPVLLTVGFAMLVLGMVKTMSAALGGEDARALGVDAVVTTEETPGLTDAAIATIPGRFVAPLRTQVFAKRSGGPAGPVPYDASGVEPAAITALAGGWQVESGSLEAFGEGASVLVASGAATELDVTVGDDLRITMADGAVVTLPVAAVLTEGSLPGRFLVSRDLVREHDPSALTGTVYVIGASAAAVESALTGTGAVVQDPLTYATNDEEDQLVWLFVLVMVGISVGYTAIAVANTLVMATGGRRRDFAVLRLTGATPGQILRMVGTETGIVALLGTVIGGLVVLPALLGIRQGFAESTGTDLPLVIPWTELAVVAATCTILALLAALLSTRVALRRA